MDREHRIRMMHEAERFRQAAIQRYGIENCIKNAESREWERAHQAALRNGRTAGVVRPRNIRGVQSQTTGRAHSRAAVATPYERTKVNQETWEHAHLTTDRMPIDPFVLTGSDPQQYANSGEAQIALLRRICSNPELIKHYPHAKDYLAKTRAHGPNRLRVRAKAAVDKYLRVAKEEPVNNLGLQIQELHERIAGQPDLSDQAKLILVMTTFIPPARYTSYAAIQEWLHQTRGMTSKSHIAGALVQGLLHFTCEEIPAHRVINQNWGRTDWGSHMPDMDDEERREIFGEEGGRFDKNGRILGSRLEFHELEAAMKGTMVENYIRGFPYRLGGYSR